MRDCLYPMRICNISFFPSPNTDTLCKVEPFHIFTKWVFLWCHLGCMHKLWDRGDQTQPTTRRSTTQRVQELSWAECRQEQGGAFWWGYQSFSKPSGHVRTSRGKLTPDVRNLASGKKDNLFGQKGLANPRYAILLLLPMGFSCLTSFFGSSFWPLLSEQAEKAYPFHTHHKNEFPTEMRYPQVSNIFVSATLSSGSQLEKNEVVDPYEKQLKILVPYSELWPLLQLVTRISLPQIQDSLVLHACKDVSWRSRIITSSLQTTLTVCTA